MYRFALSRLEEVAIISNKEKYNKMLDIKKENVFIIGVSTNTFWQGLDYYLQNLDKYKQLSHIDSLQNAAK